MKTLFRILTAITLFTTLSYANHQVKIGIYENPPKMFIDPLLHKPSGFFIDIIEYIANKNGWEIIYKRCEWKQCLKMVERGEIDIMPDVAFSKSRAEIYEFNREPILTNWSQFFIQKDKELISIGEIKDKKIAILGQSVQLEYIKEISINQNIQIEIIETNSLKEV